MPRASLRAPPCIWTFLSSLEEEWRMTRTRGWLELSAPDIGARLQGGALPLLVTGSVEQHGPHLPCGTDYMAALVIAQRVAEKLGALLLPLSPLGVAPYHRAFPGSLTLAPETFIALFRDVCEGLARGGASRAAVLNWHEGNMAPLQVAALGVRQKVELDIVLVQAFLIAHELFGATTPLTHAGEMEILPVVAYDASLVDLGRATNPSPLERGLAQHALYRRVASQPILADFRSVAPTGWYGPLGSPTPESAEAFVEAVAERAAAYIRETFDGLRKERG